MVRNGEVSMNSRINHLNLSNLDYPYYKIGDALELVKEIPDESVDLVLTDPPYFDIVNEEWDNSWKDIDEYILWLESVLNDCHRILKKNGSLYFFGSFKWVYETLNLIQKINFDLKNMIIWHHEVSGRQHAKHHFTITYDIIYFIVKNKKEYTFNLDSVRIPHWYENDPRVNPLGKNPGCVWYFYNPNIGKHKENVRHRAVKPVALFERIIKVSSNEGDIVLDPFLGSGTTLLACRKLNRKGIGFEIKPEYESIIRERALMDIPNIESFKISQYKTLKNRGEK
jgi:DNA modification methylase